MRGASSTERVVIGRLVEVAPGIVVGSTSPLSPSLGRATSVVTITTPGVSAGLL